MMMMKHLIRTKLILISLRKKIEFEKKRSRSYRRRRRLELLF